MSSDRMTLFQAIETGDISIVQARLDNPLRDDELEDYHISAAVRREDIPMVRFLLSNPVRTSDYRYPNDDDHVITQAARTGNLELFNIIYEYYSTTTGINCFRQEYRRVITPFMMDEVVSRGLPYHRDPIPILNRLVELGIPITITQCKDIMLYRKDSYRDALVIRCLEILATASNSSRDPIS
jgi:hypothetical protein